MKVLSCCTFLSLTAGNRATLQYGSNKTKGQKRDKEADKMAY